MATGYTFVKTSVNLQQSRQGHMCWIVSNGVLLIGGSYSPRTTELVLPHGAASSSSFGLLQDARYQSNSFMQFSLNSPYLVIAVVSTEEMDSL